MNSHAAEIARLISEMTDEYGESIAAVFGRALTLEEAQRLGYFASVRLAETIRQRSLEIQTSAYLHLNGRARKFEGAY